jgi:hypothetical protein
MQSGGGGGGVVPWKIQVDCSTQFDFYNGSFCHTPLGIRVNFILSIYLNLFLKGGRA